MLSELELAALLCSRICHDLISPISALNNGLEVLDEEEDEEMRANAVTLIEMSGKQASDKLQFARMAYGASSTTEGGLDLEEAGRILDSLFEGGKISLEWQAPAQIADKSLVKLLLNMALIARDSVPRGGVVTVMATTEPGQRRVVIEAIGEKAKINSDTRSALLGELDKEHLNARSIQPHFIHLVATSCGMRIDCTQTEEKVTLTADETERFR